MSAKTITESLNGCGWKRPLKILWSNPLHMQAARDYT